MASSSRHAWESYGWENPGNAPEGAHQWDSDEEAEDTPAEAGETFAELLISCRLKGVLSARQTCLLAYWAGKAGACGPAADFGLRPGEPTGHCQRKIDTYLGL